MVKLNKRGMYGLQSIPSVAIVFVLAATVIAVGAYVLTEINTSAGFTVNSTAYNATAAGQTSLGTLATWLPIIAVVVASVILISMLVSSFRSGGP